MLVAIGLVGVYFISRESGNTINQPVNIVNQPIDAQADWLTFTSDQYGFVIKYPPSYLLNEDVTANLDWQWSGEGKGTRAVTFSLPRDSQPGTNLSEAQVHVGISDDSATVATCLNPQYYQATGQSVQINNLIFQTFTYNGAGVGNFYEVSSYRLQDKTRCYVIEIMMHSGNIGNYDPPVKEFDKVKVQSALEEIVQTFGLIK